MIDTFIQLGLSADAARVLFHQIQAILKQNQPPEKTWMEVAGQLQGYPFNIHLYLFEYCYPQWRRCPESAPAIIPSPETIATANISRMMAKHAIPSPEGFHAFTAAQRELFWQEMTEQLGICFQTPFHTVCDLSQGVKAPIWFKGATMNIAQSCFQAPAENTALIYEDTQGQLQTLSYGMLDRLSNRIANSLLQRGFHAGDAIAIVMPMNPDAVAIYLGIIKMGAIVVSIADSFSDREIATRLALTRARALFTQDQTIWSGNKPLLLHEKVRQACLLLDNAPAPAIFVVPYDKGEGHCAFADFLLADEKLTPHPCQPMDACNILFSSGTTATPKAIPWNHSTPIKAASDAWLNHNIQPGDVLAWPTSLGWMMGPWIIFAALINKASLALYTKTPADRAFGEFIQRTQVTMLGVVPTLVATWRQTRCMENLDWHSIKAFSSSGECSNPEDMLYLMSLAGYKPVIEYCGGTEIGGAFLSSTVIEKNYPALFNGPTMGLDILILDEAGQPAATGEVAIVPPSIGLSTTLLNADHDDIYYRDMPRSPDGKILRRHGDEIRRYPGGHYSILGRTDDTMNLGGIKVSAAEIERCLSGLPPIQEVAAIAIVPPDNGPSQLIIYAATTASPDKQAVINIMQEKIRTTLNPLFKIHDVIFVPALPKTTSSKIMRRTLRKMADKTS